MKARLVIVLLSASLFSIQFTNAQTTNISGIVNTYYSVVEIIPAKACIRLNTTSGLSPSETVMIVQMKGASVLTVNNNTFGDTTSLNNAGNYELNTICGMRGDSVFLFYSLLNNYTIPGKVQLVGVPTYYSAVVTDSLKALPWNNTTGTGGVIALDIDQSLTLNAPISADNSGFKGGAYVVSSGTCSNATPANGYIYNANTTNPQSGAFKGESVFDVTAAQSGGRGAVANGGGGGNNHNNSGGGGANLTVGGDGGGNSSTKGCLANNNGLKGKALSSWNGKKIFPGGGGGAGHSDANSTPTYGGGNGGGIIFIRAKNLISNNSKISANGEVGGPTLSDGASGGGAGGTIIADIENYSGTLAVEAKGGNGGAENDGLNIKYCYGAGGGGGGGVVYFTGSLPSATLSTAGGFAGAETGRDPACNAIIPAVAGNTGITVANYNYTSSVTPANYCTAIALPVGLTYFKALLNIQKVLLQWKVNIADQNEQFIVERKTSGHEWEQIGMSIIVTSSPFYQLTDESPFQGANFYRLKIIKQNNAATYSPIQKIDIAGRQESIKIYPNPAKDHIVIQGKLPVDADIKLLSAEGKFVFGKHVLTNQQTLQLDLPKLTAGIYFLQINTQVKKIILK